MVLWVNGIIFFRKWLFGIFTQSRTSTLPQSHKNKTYLSVEKINFDFETGHRCKQTAGELLSLLLHYDSLQWSRRSVLATAVAQTSVGRDMITSFFVESRVSGKRLISSP